MAKRYNTRSKKTRRGGKSKYSSKPKVMLMDAQAVRQLTVYRYPFSTATSNPKIPDGKLTQSIGYRWMHSTTIDAPNMLFILAPLFMTVGISCPVTENNDVVQTLYNWHTNVPESSVTTHVGTNRTLNYNGAIGRWRVVSQALKLKCINSDDMNDGHWEAIRIPSTDARMVTPFFGANFNGCGHMSHRWVNAVKTN